MFDLVIEFAEHLVIKTNMYPTRTQTKIKGISPFFSLLSSTDIYLMELVKLSMSLKYLTCQIGSQSLCNFWFC